MKKYLPFLLVLFAFAPKTGSDQLPAADWLQYKTPEDAGFSTQKLQKARDLAIRYKSANVLIIYKGAIVQSWGDASRKFRLHSARKATQSALIGIYASKGKIDLNKSIGEYGIDEVTPLTEIEKQATVKQLIPDTREYILHHPEAMVKSPNGARTNLANIGFIITGTSTP